MPDWEMVTKGLVTYSLYPGGLINQLMSIENASIISLIIDNEVLVHGNTGLDSSWRKINEKRAGLIGNSFPKINDLIISRDSLFFQEEHLEDQSICFPEKRVENFYTTAVSVDGSKPSDEFLDGRDWIHLDSTLNYRFIQTLGWYSIVFWNVSNLKTSDFKINFKSEYVDFASNIIKELGKFSSIHIRGRDMERFWDAKSFDINEAMDDLAGESIVIITDEPDVVRVESKKNIISIDTFIMDNFLDEFMKLPFHDETTFGLICLLVACGSIDFSGTFGSSYSGYIHRQMRIKDNKYKYKFIGHNPPEEINVNPWCLYKNLSIDTKIWCRQWL